MMDTSITIAWPPQYRLRKHKRARSVKFCVSKYKGLEITVPYRFNLQKIPSILAENKDWIVKQLTNLATQHTNTLPNQLQLNAINENWSIYYVPSNQRLKIIDRPHHELVLVGQIENKKLCKKKLISWIKQRAQHYLTSQLQRISGKTQLFCNSLTIRDQQTRWGSCSIRKSINLNYRLIFLPFNLVEHIIIHELCHTKYLNHSKLFWSLVAQYDPEWINHRSKMRHADQYIPNWL